MNCQQNCNKLKKFSKLGLIRIFFLKLSWKKTLGSAWKITVGRVSGNKQLFFYALRQGVWGEWHHQAIQFLKAFKNGCYITLWNYTLNSLLRIFWSSNLLCKLITILLDKLLLSVPIVTSILPIYNICLIYWNINYSAPKYYFTRLEVLLMHDF